MISGGPGARVADPTEDFSWPDRSTDLGSVTILHVSIEAVVAVAVLHDDRVARLVIEAGVDDFTGYLGRNRRSRLRPVVLPGMKLRFRVRDGIDPPAPGRSQRKGRMA